MKKIDVRAPDLSAAVIGDYVSEYSYEEALDAGVLVKVTAWVCPEMGFARDGRLRVTVAVTAQLFGAIGAVPPLARTFQTLISRGSDVLWIASYALRKARLAGSESAAFQAFLPTRDEASDVKEFRVEHNVRRDGPPIVVVGFSEELAML